jgi:hypothetical protein
MGSGSDDGKLAGQGGGGGGGGRDAPGRRQAIGPVRRASRGRIDGRALPWAIPRRC